VAKGQHLQGSISQPQSVTEVGVWVHLRKDSCVVVTDTSPFMRGFTPPPTKNKALIAAVVGIGYYGRQ
jgi:hypothetical protein